MSLEDYRFDFGYRALKEKFLMEIVQAKFNIWFYTKEVMKPKVVSKTVAMENVGLYQKHLEQLERTLKDLEEYGGTKGL